MRLAAAILAVSVVLAWLVWLQPAGDEPRTVQPESPGPVADGHATKEARPLQPDAAQPVVQNDASAAAQAAPGLPEKCWEIEDIDNQGLPEDELALIYSAAPLGPDFESFRHLDAAALESLAAQGDSAAMTLLAIMKLGEAYGAGPDAIYALVTGEDPDVDLPINPRAIP